MRVSTSTFPNLLVQQLNKMATQQARLQTQVATGQRIQNPEDDPAAMHRVLNLETEQRALDQFQHNIADLSDSAQANFSVMKGLKATSDRAGEIATLADGTRSPQDLRIYATEITQLIQQGVQLVNSRRNGSYQFAGTDSAEPPFVLTQDANGAVQSVVYRGNTSVIQAEISEGSLLSVQAIGANDTGAGPRGLISDTRFGADYFNHLISLQNHLLAGDTDQIASSDLPALGQDEENLLYHVGTNGAVQAQLEASQILTNSRAEGVNGLISKDADADLAQSMVELTRTQTAYSAALQSASTILSQSLLDYLR